MKNKTSNRKLSKPKKRRFHAILPILLIVGLLLCSGQFLTLSESPIRTDVIIILSGGWGRVEKGANLYQQQYAPKLLLSNARESGSRSTNMQATAIARGIPLAAILTENEALSTYQNAELTLPIMQQHGFTSAIVVSSDFHMRRVKFIFDHVYKNSGIKLTYVGANSGYNAKWWWSDRYSRETTFNEYIKMIGNAFGYNGPEAKGTLQEIKHWFPLVMTIKLKTFHISTDSF